jgi:hypothetical protein
VCFGRRFERSERGWWRGLALQGLCLWDVGGRKAAARRRGRLKRGPAGGARARGSPRKRQELLGGGGGGGGSSAGSTHARPRAGCWLGLSLAEAPESSARRVIPSALRRSAGGGLWDGSAGRGEGKVETRPAERGGPESARAESVSRRAKRIPKGGDSSARDRLPPPSPPLLGRAGRLVPRQLDQRTRTDPPSSSGADGRAAAAWRQPSRTGLWSGQPSPRRRRHRDRPSRLTSVDVACSRRRATSSCRRPAQRGFRADGSTSPPARRPTAGRRRWKTHKGTSQARLRIGNDGLSRATQIG